MPPRKLGYLAPPGSFGEQAALRYDPNALGVDLPSHAAITDAASRGTIDEGVVAIENSIEGTVLESVDAIIKHENIHIRAELVLTIEHFLIAAPGTALRDITVVTSHPQALGQCRAYLEELQREQPITLEAALSTAGAVAEAVKTPGYAAIGSRRAAELSGGHILASRLQDVADNRTRFFVLGREDVDPTGDDKTSIAFTTAHDQPGSLVNALSELSTRGINMTRIESRPSRLALGVYVFLIDIQGHREEQLVAEALAAVKQRADFFRILGSYPRFVEK